MDHTFNKALISATSAEGPILEHLTLEIESVHCHIQRHALMLMMGCPTSLCFSSWGPGEKVSWESPDWVLLSRVSLWSREIQGEAWKMPVPSDWKIPSFQISKEITVRARCQYRDIFCCRGLDFISLNEKDNFPGPQLLVTD